MNKFIFQSLLMIAGASLFIQPIAPSQAIAAQNFTRSRIDRHPQDLPHGLALAAAEQRNDDRSGLLSETSISQRKPKPPKPDNSNNRSRKNPSQSKNASNVPVAKVYRGLSKSPEYQRFVRQGFRMEENGFKRESIKNKELQTELRKIEQNQWRKVYMDGFIRNRYVRNDVSRVSIHYFENIVTRHVYDVKMKEGWSVLK
jgi:hypothetical protein